MKSSDELNQHPDDRVREMLKNLPKVNAPDDFDLQLQRRINAEQGGAAEPWSFGKFFKMSALVYSVAALFLICGLSFFILYRTRSLENRESQQIPSIASESSKENIFPRRNEETVRATPSDQVENSSAKNSEGKNNQSGNNGTGSGEKKGQAAGGMNEGKSVTRGEMNRSESKNDEHVNEGVQPRAGKNQLQTKSVVQPVPAIGSANESKGNLQLQQNEVVQPGGNRLKATSIAPQMTKPSLPALMRNIVSPRSTAKAKFGVQSMHDSAARRDSLLLDSLKKARKINDSSVLAPRQH
jgi:hypothetical protein